jgi:hypothetical protein
VVDGGDYSAPVGNGEGSILFWGKGRGLVWRTQRDRRELTGGQKSSWASTTISAGLNELVAIVTEENLYSNRKAKGSNLAHESVSTSTFQMWTDK